MSFDPRLLTTEVQDKIQFCFANTPDACPTCGAALHYAGRLSALWLRCEASQGEHFATMRNVRDAGMATAYDDLETQCNTMFCIADKHDDETHVDATAHSWQAPNSDTAELAHVYSWSDSDA